MAKRHPQTPAERKADRARFMAQHWAANGGGVRVVDGKGRELGRVGTRAAAERLAVDAFIRGSRVSRATVRRSLAAGAPA